MEPNVDPNPYRILDDILDLLLTITPDKAMALECAGRAGIDVGGLNTSAEMYDLLRDILSAAFDNNQVAALLEEFATRLPAQRPSLEALMAAWRSAPPPNLHAPPTQVISGAAEAIGGGRDLPDTDEVQTATVEGFGQTGQTTHEPPTAEGIATLVPPARPQAGEDHLLRLDTGVPRSVVVGEAFQLAVTVRQVSSPLLARENLQVISSSDLQVLWPDGAPYITLRTQISAPDCIIDGSASDSFKLFAGRDSPVFLYNLTPKRTGNISILVSIYQEFDRLGTAGVEIKARSRRSKTAEGTAGAMQLTVQSVELAPQGSLEVLQPLREILVELFGRDRDAPRVLAEQAGLDVSQIPYSPRTADYLWDVLVEAHTRNAVEKLVEQACERNADRKDDILAAFEAYRKLAV